MPFKGELKRGIPFTIDVSVFAGTFGWGAAITIVKINQRGGMHATSTTLAQNTTGTINEILGQRIIRMIVHVNLDAGGHVNTRVLQDSSQYTDSLDADAELVFNAVP